MGPGEAAARTGRRADTQTGRVGAVALALCVGLSLAALAAHAPGARAAEDFEDSTDAQPGGRLRVDLDAGSIQIEGQDEHEVRVDARATGIGSDDVDFELDSDDGEVRLSVDRGGLGFLARLGLRVRVPHRFSLEVRTAGGEVVVEEIEGEVRIRTSGGEVTVDDVIGPVDIETSGGTIRADKIQGDLRARTSGGRIRAADVSGRLEVRTSGGPLELRDVGGPVEARTSGGPIEVRFSGGPAGDLETSGGSIEVEFAAGSGARLEARTSGGRVEMDPDLVLRGRVVEPDRVEGEIGGGGPELRLRTSGGNIVLRAH